MDDDKIYWLALNKVPGVGPILYGKLIAQFGGPKEVFAASGDRLREVEGIGEELVRRIKEGSVLEEGRRELMRAKELGMDIITIREERYPSNLRQIPDPPPLLYVKGDLTEGDALAVAVVGSRRCSPYGRAFARKVSRELASRGVTVVSGMARGIDTEAHRGALEVGGRTIAVFGSGLDVIYPSENRGLFEEIWRNGAAVSEFPLSTPPERWNFPLRNRIISGLALGVVVVEASSRSGALITASMALEQGRSVFAVPGYAGAVTSRGTHHLIKEGAKLIEGAEDILEEILPQYEGGKEKAPSGDLTREERKVLEVLEVGPMQIDEIARKVEMEVQKLASLLLEMELKGLVTQMPGKVFALA